MAGPLNFALDENRRVLENSWIGMLIETVASNASTNLPNSKGPGFAEAEIC